MLTDQSSRCRGSLIPLQDNHLGEETLWAWLSAARDSVKSDFRRSQDRSALPAPLTSTDLPELSIGEDGVSLDGWINSVRSLMEHGHNPRHSGWCGQMNGPPLAPGIAADAIISYLDNNMIVPGLAMSSYLAEKRATEFLAQGFGLGSQSDAVYYESGSLANLHGLLLARNSVVRSGQFTSRADLVSRGRILASPLAHQSVSKAADVLGLEPESVRFPAVDDQGRLTLVAIRSEFEQIRQDGGSVFAVVLTAGTTGIGAIDEIPGVIEFCRREGLWVHVDAAFGGAIAFADQHRVDLFSGNVPDSLTFNPHKLFNVPRGLAVLLCPAGREFRENFSHSLPYIPGEQDWTTRSVVSLNGTGRASGARLLLSLLPLGRAGVAAHIDHYMEVTLALYDHLERDGRWSFVARPRLPHMAFRPTGSPDHALETLHASIRSAGWELSVTRWNGQSWLRFILCRPDLDWRRLAADLSLGLS